MHTVPKLLCGVDCRKRLVTDGQTLGHSIYHAMHMHDAASA